MPGEKDRPRRGSPRKHLPHGPPAPLTKTEPARSVWPARRASLSESRYTRGGAYFMCSSAACASRSRNPRPQRARKTCAQMSAAVGLTTVP